MPSLVGPHLNMNSHDYDRGGHARINGTNGGYDYNRDDFGREDMRREDDDRYRRGVRNGGPTFETRFNTDYLDQTSLSEFRSNEPKFELDHLATFAAGTRNGVIHAEDGLRKLRQMENTTGIWTMRCMLIVERGNLVILDNSTAEELERFPIQLVQDPTAIFKNDRREIYNNLILFTIVDDAKRRASSADMHIFQSCKSPAQEIVDEILAAQKGQQRIHPPGGSRIPPPPMGPAPEPPYDLQGMSFGESRQFVGQQRSFITRVGDLREKEDYTGGSTEILERDVQLLNHCFDDIEKFVARLQQAAESYKELERRKRDRGAKNKKRQSGDGMLNARARPPPDRDFVDIFQKFKLSFNLLAKLKAHIHDPNAPELVHFLFTPLSLIYEASRDPFHGNQNLGDQAVAPVLTADAKQLLNNCLTTKEVELWQALGKHWTTSRDEWIGPIPPYVPEFYDGWQPAAPLLEDMTVRSFLSHPVHENPPRGFGHGPPRPMPFPDEDRPPLRMDDDFDRSESNSHAGFEPMPGPSGLSPRLHRRAPPSGHHFVTEIVEKPHPESNITRAIVEPKVDDNAAYFEELRSMGNVLIYEAAHERTGKNEKELTVQKGDILQVLDNSRNWWKLRNHKGQVGFAPYTILKAVKTDLEHYPPHSDRGLTNGGGLPPMSYRSDNYIDDNSSRRGVSRRAPADRSSHSDQTLDAPRVRSSGNSPRSGRAAEVTHINERSSAAEVTEWLANKKFSERTVQVFRGHTGLDMFHLRLPDFQQLLGRDEATRLDGLLTLQKNSSGYGTRTAKELNAILQRRKQHVTETDNQPEDQEFLLHHGDAHHSPQQQQHQQQQPSQAERQQMFARSAQGPDFRADQSGASLQQQLIRQKSQLRQSQVELDAMY